MADKLVRLEDALNVCERYYQSCIEMHDNNARDAAEDIKINIENMPTADVDEVVRCVDCIHIDKKGICTKFRQRYPFYPEDDFYCAFGERRKKKND